MHREKILTSREVFLVVSDGVATDEESFDDIKPPFMRRSAEDRDSRDSDNRATRDLTFSLSILLSAFKTEV